MLRLTRHPSAARTRVAVLLLLAVLAGCAGQRYSYASSTAGGQATEILVLGRRPTVSVENGGPGLLAVTFSSRGGADDRSVLGRGLAERTLHGPVRLRLTPVGDERCEWKLRIDRCAGLEVDLIAGDAADGGE